MIQAEQQQTRYRLDLTPGPSQLRSVADRNLNWITALGELIDNSFDAEANGVHFDFSRASKKGCVVIRDDGKGTANLQAMLRLGDHAPGPGSKLGRFGVGLKEAVLWIGGLESKLEIVSVHQGIHRSVTVNWGQIVRASSWADVDVFVDPREARPGETQGTVITIRNPSRKLPHGKRLHELCDDVGYLYSAAIKQNRQITLKTGRAQPRRIERWALPKLEVNHVDRKISVGNKTAWVYAGIVRAGETNQRAGLTYLHEFRVIKRNCTAGLNGVSPAHIAGFVEVDEKWPLTTNKDDLRSGEALYEAVAEALAPILARAEQRSSVLASRAFDDSIKSMLNDALGLGKTGEKARPTEDGDQKERRSTGNETGTKKPKNTGKRRGGEKLKPGNSLRRRGVTSIEIDWNNYGDNRVGEVKLPNVLLNANNILMARMRETQNTEGIVSNVMWLLAEYDQQVSENGQQKLFRDATGELSITVGDAIAHENILDGMTIGKEKLAS